MRFISYLIILFSLSSLSLAQDIRFTRKDLQKTLDSYMPYTQQYNIVQITLDNSELSLSSEQQRIQIRTDLQVSTALGGEGNGWATLSGKLRYKNINHSFYVDDLRIIDMEIEGFPREFKPQIMRLTQEVVAPLLAEQPIYTLSEKNIQESLAKMMLRSITIKENAVVASLSMF